MLNQPLESDICNREYTHKNNFSKNKALQQLRFLAPSVPCSWTCILVKIQIKVKLYAFNALFKDTAVSVNWFWFKVSIGQWKHKNSLILILYRIALSTILQVFVFFLKIPVGIEVLFWASVGTLAYIFLLFTGYWIAADFPVLNCRQISGIWNN